MGDPTIFDEPHHQSLEILSARALASGDIPAAFRYADRRCRIPPLAEPHCFVLRAEALYRLGEKAAAISDLNKALEIAPEDIAANRRMLAWSEGPRQRKAAQALIARDRDFDVVARAIKSLRNEGEEAFARVTVLDDSVEGWAAWVGDGHLEVTITGGGDTATASFEPDPFHSLAGRFLHAVSFTLARPKSHEPQSVHLSRGDEVFHVIRAPGNESDMRLSERKPSATAGMEGTVTVIVPVYADYEATKACLESLRGQLSAAHRAIVVDDATPDRRIARYLAHLSNAAHVQVLANAKNLGFVGAINRALAEIDGGDILLLNSDTVVPDGFIARLAAAAKSSPDIGTVTPLSNNGEFTSFPVANRVNPLAPLDEIARLDAIAARVNAGRVVDVPNGIGFCLYVTRECLDAVGSLSESFHRGYLEDVDFCLRAREAGFRNVCAASVYVGHAGSRSFKEEKRSLVVRNLDVIVRRFPNYRAECAAFVLADPLRASREAIERAAPPQGRRPRILVAGAGAVGEIIRERGRQLAHDGKSALLLEIGRGEHGPTAGLRAANGALPQSIKFDLSSEAERRALRDYLEHAKASRIEIADPANTPEQLLDLLLDVDVPFDLFIADAGLRCSPRAPISCAAAAGARNDGEAESEAWQRYWRTIAKRADHIVVPDGQAGAFAARVLPKRKAIREKPVAQHRFARQRGREGFGLGLVPVRLCPQEHRLMHDLALGFGRQRPEVSLLVLGATLDDLALLRLGNVFVTGPVDATEADEALRGYGLHAIFLCTTRPLFGHPAQIAAMQAPLPVAFFDWSAGRCKPRPGDLPIDPEASVEDIAAAIGGWI